MSFSQMTARAGSIGGFNLAQTSGIGGAITVPWCQSRDQIHLTHHLQSPTTARIATGSTMGDSTLGAMWQPMMNGSMVSRQRALAAIRKDTEMEFKKNLTIDAPSDRVWEVVAHEFDQVGIWSSGVATSGPDLDAPIPDGATVGGWVCATPGFGDLNETFASYSEENKQFTFVVSGMPSFITLAQSTVNVRPIGNDTTDVSLHIQMETNAVGRLMGPMFSIKLKAALNTFLDELKAYIERDEVSSKKRKQLAKTSA